MTDTPAPQLITLVGYRPTTSPDDGDIVVVSRCHPAVADQQVALAPDGLEWLEADAGHPVNVRTHAVRGGDIVELPA